jgi:ribosome-associated heat shock protein Hsp15
MDDTRVDKWLWNVRQFKTRSQATDACRKGRVFVGDTAVKPSRILKPGDIVEVKKPPVLYRFKVLAVPSSRLSAKLVPEYLEDLTPHQEVIKLDLMRVDISGQRDRGTGRPTKKERRLLDDWQNNDLDDDE